MGFWRNRWDDLRGNLLWYLLSLIFGGGLITTVTSAIQRLRHIPLDWLAMAGTFAVSVIGLGVVTLVASRHSRKQSELPQHEPDVVSLRAERDQAKQDNEKLRDQIAEGNDKSNKSLLLSGQFKAEADELYADAVFEWLRKHILSTGTFSPASLAKSVGLPEDAVRRGLDLLRSKYQIVSQRSAGVDAWTFVAGATPFVPKYKIVIAEQMSRNSLEDSKVLGTLPVYHHHFSVELLEVCQGHSMQWRAWFLFLRLRLICSETVGVSEVKATVYTETEKHEGTQLANLKEWYLRREIQLPQYPYRSTSEEDMESLWEKLEGQAMKSGEPVHGWLGFQILEEDKKGDSLKKTLELKLTLEDGLKRKQVNLFSPSWPVTNTEVRHVQLRRLSG